VVELDGLAAAAVEEVLDVVCDGHGLSYSWGSLVSLVATSRAAMESVFMMMIIATKKMKKTNPMKKGI
jgi:hypothetical protein